MNSKYTGMTVNERLYVAGVLDGFDKAVREKDIDKVTSILMSVELPDSAISPILETLGMKPKSGC